MKIDGKAIAASIFQDLTKRVALLKANNKTPHLAIILVGENPASVSYVKRKKLKAEEIGAKATILNYPSTPSAGPRGELGITNQELLDKINELNDDNTVHGIIVQRPLPPHIDNEAINQAVVPSKDIDAFHTNTQFVMPLAKTVLLLLETVYKQRKDTASFQHWLQTKNIVLIGKGQTGGDPIKQLLKKYDVIPTIIDSKTPNPQEITKKADIIIAAVGKKDIVTSDMIKKGVILISVGQHKEDDGKFHGDYDDEAVASLASYHSPTPGGVGPVNVACLLTNLIQACENSA